MDNPDKWPIVLGYSTAGKSDLLRLLQLLTIEAPIQDCVFVVQDKVVFDECDVVVAQPEKDYAWYRKFEKRGRF